MTGLWTLLAAVAAALGVAAALAWGYVSAARAGFEEGFRKGVEHGHFEALRTVREREGRRVRKSGKSPDGDAA